MKILKYELNGQEIDVMSGKNSIAYTMEIEGKRYGNSVILPSKKLDDIISASMLLFINIIETKKKIYEDSRLRERTKKYEQGLGDSGESK